ncbi:MAG: hypothetical protein KIT00_02360 [Rhodospirillales bacterium]|nr:hypothetical protein [Rhodospirillales bacterium]
MFGLSLPKILFTVLVAYAVWSAYRWWNRTEARRKAEVEARMREEVARASSLHGRGNRPNPDKAEETECCPVCNTYVATGAARSCGRRDCPFPG